MDIQTTRRVSLLKKVLGISLIAVPLAVVVLMIVSKTIAKGVFGVFGFLTFIIMAVMVLTGIALLKNARYTYPVRYIVYLTMVVLSVLSIFHLIFANKYLDLTFAEYTKALFNNFSAGGIVLGSLAFGLTRIIYKAGAYVFYIVLCAIFAALLIDVRYAEKQFKRLSSRSRKNYVSYEAKQSGEMGFSEHEKIEKKKERVEEESPVLVSLTNSNFRRPVNNNAQPQTVVREQQKSPGTTRAEDALTKLGLAGKNSSKLQDELVKKQLQQFISTPDSIQAEPFIKSNETNSENATIISDSSINEANRTYQNTINPVKRVYNNVNETIEPEPQPTRVTPIRNARFRDRDVAPTVEPLREERRETSPILGARENKVLSSESTKPIELNTIKPEEEKRSIKEEVNDIEARINSILDAEKEEEKNATVMQAPVNETKPENETQVRNEQISIDSLSETLNNNTDTRSSTADDGAFIDENGNNAAQLNTSEDEKEEVVEEKEAPKSDLVKAFMERFSQPQKPVQETFIDKPSKKPAPVFSLSTNSSYVKPPIDLLKDYAPASEAESEAELMLKAEILEETLKNFKIEADVINITRGPAVTRYEIKMPPGKNVKLIQSISDNIAMALEAKGDVRIEAPIPGRNAVGIEVPNENRDTIGIKEVLASKDFENSKGLSFVLGKDIAGANMLCDIAEMPHLLVAGSTGSGKSVCLNVLIISLLYRYSPEDLKLILIDPKRVEFAAYAGLPHLIMPEPITDVKNAINSLNWVINEMDRRYELFHSTRVNHINEYNALPDIKSGKEPKLPLIVVIVDELNDLMMQSKRDVEDRIKRLTALARASGIHLIVATQRPSVDVITGTIKANLPSRIAFAVTSIADSKTILDGGGAENLLGRGDMLYSPREFPEPMRIQGAFISNGERQAVVEYIKQNNEAYYDENIANEICRDEEEEKLKAAMAAQNSAGEEDFKLTSDPLFPKALKLAIETKQASVSMIQRRFSVGFARAARILDQMELANFVSPQDENRSKPRTVYITMEEFREIFPDEA